jgi:plastocyanin
MKKFAVALALILASVALVACGGGSDNSTSSESTAPATESEKTEEAEGGTAGSAGSVAFEADPEGSLAFTTKTATAESGKVTVEFNNSSPVTHDVAIEDSGGETIGQTEQIAEGSDSTVVNLKPGTYTFYCSVPGHREAGMEGTLTVE